MQNKEKKESNHINSFKILIGLFVGIIGGAILKNTLELETLKFIVTNITSPLGNLFLRSLFMVVIPLVFTSLIVGVAQIGSIESLGKLGKRVAIFYFCTVLIAVLIGQGLVNTIKPGEGVDRSFIETSKAAFGEQTSKFLTSSATVNQQLWPGIVENIVPKNIILELGNGNMLSTIFVAILFGIALLRMEGPGQASTIGVLSTISNAMIMIIGWVMRLAPIAVAALMFNAVVQFDISIIGNVAKYFMVVVLGYSLHFFGTYLLIVKFLVRLPIKYYLKQAMPLFVTSFSTSSSNATLPTTIRVLQERFGVPERITTFCAPLGATINMDGTALFEMVAAVFIAQLFGIDLSLTDHLTLLFLIIATSVGVGGIPGGSIPLLMSNMAVVGIPPEGIAIILGVDRLLDMGRTVLNTTGDALASLYLSRVEKVPLEDFIPADQNS